MQRSKCFRSGEIGYFHTDSCKLHHADGKVVMLLAIDRNALFDLAEGAVCEDFPFEPGLTRSPRCDTAAGFHTVAQ